MKKVLIISSSPRKGGNSDMLCSRFAQGARESGHRVEKVFLREKFIAYCTGCGYCFHSHKCSLKSDDMNPLLDAMLAAEGAAHDDEDGGQRRHEDESLELTGHIFSCEGGPGNVPA